MAEFRKWTLHFDDGNNLIDGKRVQDPPGFAAGGGKELVSASGSEMLMKRHSTNHSATLLAIGLQVTAGTNSKHLNMDVALLKQKRQDVGIHIHLQSLS